MRGKLVRVEAEARPSAGDVAIPLPAFHSSVAPAFAASDSPTSQAPAFAASASPTSQAPAFAASDSPTSQAPAIDAGIDLR